MRHRTTKEKQSYSKRMEKSFHSQLRFRLTWIKTLSENLSSIMAWNISSAVKQLLKNPIRERKHLFALWQFSEQKRRANSKKYLQLKIFTKRLEAAISLNNSSKKRTISNLKTTSKRWNSIKRALMKLQKKLRKQKESGMKQ